ncbi:hypothetical protein EOM09_03475 [bacterium]|nr:hypothetical protein [bacterium]
MEQIIYNENEPLTALQWINDRKKLIAFEYKETTKSLYFKVDKSEYFIFAFDKCKIIFDGKNFIIER